VEDFFERTKQSYVNKYKSR